MRGDGSFRGRAADPTVATMPPQVRALRCVAGGAAALVSALCLLIVSGLWRQRLLLRKAEFFVHWAVGARRVQFVARLLGEGRAWVGGAIVFTVLGSATLAALIERLDSLADSFAAAPAAALRLLPLDA